MIVLQSTKNGAIIRLGVVRTIRNRTESPMRTRTCPVCGRLFSRSSEKAPWARTCSRDCGQHLRYGDWVARFWSNVDQSGGPDACWPWKRLTMKGGHGRLGRNGRLELAHRVAYELSTGKPIPPGTDILHDCDNPPCCNPKHLHPGDRAMNNREAYERGRQPSRAGTRNGRAILTNETALAIYLADGTQGQIAAEFGISQPTVSEIKRGLKWAHVTGAKET